MCLCVCRRLPLVSLYHSSLSSSSSSAYPPACSLLRSALSRIGFIRIQWPDAVIQLIETNNEWWNRNNQSQKLNETNYMRVIIKCNKCAAADVSVEYINTKAPDAEPKLQWLNTLHLIDDSSVRKNASFEFKMSRSQEKKTTVFLKTKRTQTKQIYKNIPFACPFVWHSSAPYLLAVWHLHLLRWLTQSGNKVLFINRMRIR